MPKDFEMCEKNGGKVITQTMSGGKYRHVCYDDKGTAHIGEIKMKRQMKRQMKPKMMK